MGQQEVIEFLEERRKLGEDWFTVTQIRQGLEDQGLSNGVLKKIHNNLYKLALFGQIEYKGEGTWQHRKLFRAKK